MIKYLDLSEKQTSRIIWEKIFQEDSKSFLDYYYTEKTNSNLILGKYINNNLVAMLHLNPYKIHLNSNLYNSYYIVAVATLKEHRKKGYMAELLKESLNYMNNEKIPFTFLRPANEEIYLPFDFNYIYDHNFSELKNYDFKKFPVNEVDYQSLADFINAELKEKYNVFTLRDKLYISNLHKEVKSENGDIIMLYDNEKFVGCYIYWGIKEKLTRAVFISENYIKNEKINPLVMARIVNLQEFFKNFSSSINKEINLYLNIKDLLIKENNGIFTLSISKHGSNLIKSEKKTYPNILNLTIGDLTSLFFGYKPIENYTKNTEIIKIFNKINLLNKIFLDEEV